MTSEVYNQLLKTLSLYVKDWIDSIYQNYKPFIIIGEDTGSQPVKWQHNTGYVNTGSGWLQENFNTLQLDKGDKVYNYSFNDSPTVNDLIIDKQHINSLYYPFVEKVSNDYLPDLTSIFKAHFYRYEWNSAKQEMHLSMNYHNLIDVHFYNSEYEILNNTTQVVLNNNQKHTPFVPFMPFLLFTTIKKEGELSEEIITNMDYGFNMLQQNNLLLYNPCNCQLLWR